MHLLRQIYSELYGKTCLIIDTYSIPILATVFCMLIEVVFNLYEGLIYYFNKWLGEDLTYGITFTVIFFKVTFFVTQLRMKQELQAFW